MFAQTTAAPQKSAEVDERLGSLSEQVCASVGVRT